MNGLVIGPETELQSTPIVHYGEAPRAAASFNHVLQRTRPSLSGCNRRPAWAGSLSLGLGVSGLCPNQR